MGARKQADHRLNRANFVGLTSVNPLAILEDSAANDFRLKLFDNLASRHLRLAIFLGKGFLSLSASSVESIAALRFVGQLIGRRNIFAHKRFQLLLHR